MPGREPRTDARHPPLSGRSALFGQLTVHAATVAFEPRGLLNSMFAVGVVGRIVHTERRCRRRPGSTPAAEPQHGRPPPR